MYSALELHKEVLQGLQSIDSFSQDMFLPEEYDFHLNKMQDSFVNELLDKGFSDRQLRLDYVQDLIVKNKHLPVFISPTAFYYESGAVTSYLPGNYKHLLTSRAKIKETVNCAKLVEGVVKYTQTLHFLSFQIPEDATAPFYSKVELVKVESASAETVIASVSMPVEDKEDIYLIVKNILYQANKDKNVDEINYYWEKYTDAQRQGVIKKNHFIIYDDSVTAPTVTLGYKLVFYNADGTVQDTVFETAESTEVEVWDKTELAKLAASKQTSSVLLDNKELYERTQNIFYFPNPQEPHSSVADGLLFTYYGNTFLIEETTIDYIREPQPISLELGQGCELSESAARIIANRTVEFLKLTIENPSYAQTLQHNEMRDQK